MAWGRNALRDWATLCSRLFRSRGKCALTITCSGPQKRRSFVALLLRPAACEEFNSRAMVRHYRLMGFRSWQVAAQTEICRGREESASAQWRRALSLSSFCTTYSSLRYPAVPFVSLSTMYILASSVYMVDNSWLLMRQMVLVPAPEVRNVQTKMEVL